MLKARSQHMMRMNRTDLNKSTQMHQALIGRAHSLPHRRHVTT